ncbi:MAG: cytochrome c peroxidase [Planctomycetaceae bacterium]
MRTSVLFLLALITMFISLATKWCRADVVLQFDQRPLVHRPLRIEWDAIQRRILSVDPVNQLLTVHHENNSSSNWSRTAWQFPGEPVDVCLESNGSSRFWLADAAGKKVNCVDLSVTPPKLVQSMPVTGTPSRVLSNGNVLAIAQQWQHGVSLASLQDEDRDSPADVPLDFAPGEMLFTRDGTHLIAADAFQGKFAVIHVGTRKVLTTLPVTIHNIGGLAWGDDSELQATCQKLHPYPTTVSNIASGLVIENLLLTLQFDSEQGTLKVRHEKELGTPSQGAADPAGIAVNANGELFIAAAGVDHLLQLTAQHEVYGRLDIGRHPAQVIADEEHNRCFVLESFTPGIRVVDMQNGATLTQLAFGTTTEKSPAQRGEELFLDARTSQFQWMSCQSCHSRAHTNGRLADTFGDGTEGAPKQVPSLLGTRDNNPWAWNGSMQTLHGQVTKSFHSTMHSPDTSARDVMDVVAYLHSLDPAPPLQVNNEEFVSSGQSVFNDRGCQRCHIPPLTFTSDLTYDVGLADENGLKKYNPPSLRGVGQRFGFFHDLRAPTLESVFEEYGHQLDDSLTPQELRALVAYLQSL